jgi:phosphoribosylanthranilate isomerase
MMVKVCGITRREDAEVAVEAGASAIGFIFYPKSPRYVVPEKARELGDGLDVLKVGVFVDETAASIESVMRAANLDVVQIYGGDAPVGSRVWKAFRDSPQLTGLCEAILLDGPATGQPFDWSIARGLRNLISRIIVAGGLDASNVADAIRIAEPWGVDASSRLESSPGIKDHEKMRQFIKAARQAS